MPSVALVATVRNERATIESLLNSMLAQSEQPAEIVIADAGSTDGTLDVLHSWAARFPLIKVVEAPGAGRSEGRNKAIAATTSDWIACTDGGAILDDGWLRELARVGTAGRTVDVVSGFFSLDARTVFELALGCVTLPDVTELHGDRFLPSSRSVLFRKQAWAAVGGYPEWLDVCEDLWFDLSLRERGATFRFAPEALAHFRPRQSLGAFFHQYFTYARGDGKALLWTSRHAVRYFTYGSAVILLLGAQRGPRNTTLVYLCTLFGAGLIYLRQPYARLVARRQSAFQRTFSSRLRALALLPLLRFTGDVAETCGYPVGLAWRAKNPAPDRTSPPRQ